MPIGVDIKPVVKYTQLPSASECPGCRCYVLSERTEYISIASAWVVNKGHGANASTVIYVDSNRTDDYIASGSESSPYKSLADALAATTERSLTHAVIRCVRGSYVLTDDATVSIPLVIHADGSDLTTTAGKTLTITKDYVSYDLNALGGAVTFAGAEATSRFILVNGTDVGVAVSLTQGTLDVKSRTQASGTVAVSGGTFVPMQTVFTSKITQTGGAITMQNCNCNTNSSTGLLNSTGGSALCENTIFSNAHATASPVVINNGSSANIFINCSFLSPNATASVVPVNFTGTTSRAIWENNNYVWGALSLPSDMPGTYLIRPTSTGTPINAQTGTTYALLPTDNGKTVTCTNASPITVNATAGYFISGQRIKIQQGGAGQVTVAGSGITITSSTTLKTHSQYSEVELVFTSQATAYLTGDRAAS